MVDNNRSGLLILLGAPLGNTADVSPRLSETLANVDTIAAEDTRRLRRLADSLGTDVTGRVMSYFDGNERQRTPQLLAKLTHGETVAVITDGGMPSVSDPGYRLVAAAIDADIDITAIPGPSAVTTALALSGLPCDRFCFEGFLPRKAGERRTVLSQLATETRTMVFFESPRRIGVSLADMALHLDAERDAALCRELTKTYEEIRRGTVAELADGVTTDPPRGEITLVVAGDTRRPVAGPQEMAAIVAELIASGIDRKAALSQTAQRFKVPKRTVYDAVLAAKDNEESP